MNLIKMGKDGTILLICVIVIIVFLVLIFYWFDTNSKPFVVDKTIEGLYKTAQLGQICIVDKITDKPGLLLPGFFYPQVCDTESGLSCIKVTEGDEYGYCKSNIGSICYNVYDCVPNTTGGQTYCAGGVCSSSTEGAVGSACSNGGTGTPISLCGPNLQCITNVCKYNNGQSCNINGDCVSDICDPVNKVCINPFNPGQACSSNNCTSGYGCTGGYCQPLLSKKVSGELTSTLEPAEPKTKGAFCGIPYIGPTENTFICNEGLICNFNAATSSPSGTTGLYGLGYCDIPKIKSNKLCNSTDGACIPPNVCYNGTCQAPLNGGVQDINYCGPDSTGFCGIGYKCNTITYKCDPEIGNLCNTSEGICISGTCNQNRLGIFTSNGNLGVTGPHFGTWKYLDLPVGETTEPSNQSQLSIYQYMSVDVNGYPVTTSRCIYYPYAMGPYLSTSAYFWYAELQRDYFDNITFSLDWNKVDIINLPSTHYVQGIKFTSGGNITTLNSFNFASGQLTSVANIYTFLSPLVSLDYTTFTSSCGFTVFPYPILPFLLSDWDVDDLYNTSIVGIVDIVYLISAISGDIPTDNTFTILNNQYDMSTSVNTAKWCKYFYNPTVNNLTNNTNFMVGTRLFNTAIIKSPNFPSDINLGEATTNGVAFSTSYTNNLSKMQLFYAADKSFRYFNNVINSSETYDNIDIAIEGYTPEYTLSDATPPPNYVVTNAKTLSMGNIDNNLYNLTTTCS